MIRVVAPTSDGWWVFLQWDYYPRAGVLTIEAALQQLENLLVWSEPVWVTPSARKMMREANGVNS